MQELKGKVAVVTGAAGGIGFGLAQQWVHEGMAVVLADRDAKLLHAATDELRSAGGDVLACVTDVSDRESVHSLADQVFDRFGAVHLLCNNAGILGPDGECLWEVSEADWDRVLGVNLRGVIYGLQMFLPRMLAAASDGHIVNTASMASFSSTPIHPCYVASKHALLAVCETLRLQLKKLGGRISTSILCPGYTRTSLIARERGSSDGPGPRTLDDEVISRATGVLQTPMEPSETAAIVAEAIRRGDFWIFPNAKSRSRIVNRMEGIIAAAKE